MSIELDARDLQAFTDMVLERGGTLTDVRFAVEALGVRGKIKRRQFRELKVAIGIVRRVAIEPRGGDDMGTIDQATEDVLNNLNHMVAPYWADRRRFAKLQAGGHTMPCAVRITGGDGECVCHIGDPEKVGRLPRHKTARGLADLGNMDDSTFAMEVAAGAELDALVQGFGVIREAGETDASLRQRTNEVMNDQEPYEPEPGETPSTSCTDCGAWVAGLSPGLCDDCEQDDRERVQREQVPTCQMCRENPIDEGDLCSGCAHQQDRESREG